MKKVYYIVILSILAAPLASGQLVYDSVRVKVASGTTCPSGWTSQSESVTTPTRHIVQVPVSIGGRAFRVTSGFVNAVWPSSTDKSAAVASGVLVIEAGSTVTVNYCALVP